MQTWGVGGWHILISFTGITRHFILSNNSSAKGDIMDYSWTATLLWGSTHVQVVLGDERAGAGLEMCMKTGSETEELQTMCTIWLRKGSSYSCRNYLKEWSWLCVKFKWQGWSESNCVSRNKEDPEEYIPRYRPRFSMSHGIFFVALYC